MASKFTLKTDIHVKPASTIEGPPDAYRNETDPRGALIIFNCNKFNHSRFEERHGSEEDILNLQEVFTQMGYECKGVARDSTKRQFRETLQYFRDDEFHSRVDSLVVVCMSHGVKENIILTDGEYINIREVYECFSNENCPNLAGKPKTFIFQLCLGEEQNQEAHTLEIDAGSISPSETSFPLSKLSDSHLCISTLPGYVSYRDPTKGSLFINYLCDVFMEHAKDTCLSDMMLKINQRFQSNQQQCQYQVLGCSRKFFFNPKGNHKQVWHNYSWNTLGYLYNSLNWLCCNFKYRTQNDIRPIPLTHEFVNQIQGTSNLEITAPQDCANDNELPSKNQKIKITHEHQTQEITSHHNTEKQTRKNININEMVTCTPQSVRYVSSELHPREIIRYSEMELQSQVIACNNELEPESRDITNYYKMKIQPKEIGTYPEAKLPRQENSSYHKAGPQKFTRYKMQPRTQEIIFCPGKDSQTQELASWNIQDPQALETPSCNGMEPPTQEIPRYNAMEPQTLIIRGERMTHQPCMCLNLRFRHARK